MVIITKLHITHPETFTYSYIWHQDTNFPNLTSTPQYSVITPFTYNQNVITSASKQNAYQTESTGGSQVILTNALHKPRTQQHFMSPTLSSYGMALVSFITITAAGSPPPQQSPRL
jgi:hypothetical protein